MPDNVLTIELKDTVAPGPLPPPPPPPPPAYQPPTPPVQAPRTQAPALPLQSPAPAASTPMGGVPLPRNPDADARRLLVEEEYRAQVRAALERLRPAVPPPAPRDPAEDAKRILGEENYRAAVREQLEKLRPPVPPPAPRDPMEEDRRLLAEETYRAEVRANLEKLRPPEPPHPPPDPAEAAKKILAAEEYHRQVREQLEKLRPPEPPAAPRDPAAEAQKLFAEEEHRKAVRAELEKLKPYEPPAPRDPAADAKRLFAEEEHRKQVQEELKKLQPLSDWEKNVRPELRVNPEDDPQLADAKRRQQHSEYEQEVDRLRKLLAPPKVLEAQRPEPWQRNLPEGLRPQQGDSEMTKAGKESAARELYNRRAEQERLRLWAAHVPGAALEQRGQQVGQLAGALPGGMGQAAGAVGRGLQGAGQLQAAMAPGGAAAAGGMAGLAAAAGPIALMATAAMELQHQVQEMGRSAVQGLGQALTRTAALDEKILGDAVERGTEVGMKALSMVPGVGLAAGLAGPAIVEGIKQVRAFGAALDQTALRLAGYSAPLARAQAEAGVRSVQRDIGRADHLGGPLAKWVEAQSSLTEDVKDLLADVLKPFLELAAEILREIAAGVHQLRKDLHTWMPGIFRAVTDADKTKLLWEQIAQAGDFLALRPPDRFQPPPAAGRAGGLRPPLGAFP